MADATRDRLGDGPHVELLTYANPLELVLAATGGMLLALTKMLVVVRDWPAKRRINNAAAAEADANAELRTEFRRTLLDAYRRGEVSARPEEIDALLGPSPLEAMARLAALEAHVEELPGDG